MADLQHLVEELSKLTVLEAAELSKKLEEAWGVSAAAPVAVAAAGGGGGGAAPAEEKTEFTIGASRVLSDRKLRLSDRREQWIGRLVEGPGPERSRGQGHGISGRGC